MITKTFYPIQHIHQTETEIQLSYPITNNTNCLKPQHYEVYKRAQARDAGIGIILHPYRVPLLKLRQTQAQRASDELQHNQQRKHLHPQHICPQEDGRQGQTEEPCQLEAVEDLPSLHSRAP